MLAQNLATCCRHALPVLICLWMSYRWTQSPGPDVEGPLLQIEQGQLRGAARLSRPDYGEKGFIYYSFQGVPYAKAPLGPLRFKAPLPPDNWTDVRSALVEGHMCCQPHVEINWMPPEINKWFLPKTWRRAWNILYSLPIIASQILHFWAQHEDCLFLNIYTKKIPRSGAPVEPSPVVVFIHGGAFFTGTANSHIYGADYLLRADLVLVTVQYRLGALGFLAPGDSDEVPGNAGLKDQLAALKWIQRNIASFGGDPKRVTLLGHSAGAASVHFHMLSRLSRGLFHRAIMLSGSAMHPWAFDDRATASRRAYKLGGILGFNGTTSDELVDFLRQFTPREIIEASYKVFDSREHGRGRLAPFVPTVEPSELEYPDIAWNMKDEEDDDPVVATSREIFMRMSPQEAMKSSDFHPVPTIVGQNSMEGILIMLPDIVAEELFARMWHEPGRIATKEKLVQLWERFISTTEEPGQLKVQL